MDYYVEFSPPESVDEGAGEDAPKLVSFVVPTFNSASTLREALISYSTQNHPQVEIIVVDGGSSDDTLAISEEYTSRIMRVRGPCGRAVFEGVNTAKGEYVALFDSDVVLPHRNWLSHAIDGFSISSRISTVWPINAPPAESALLTRAYFRHWRVIVEDRIRLQRGLLGGGNSIFRSDLLRSVSPLARDTHWGDDFVRSAELKRRGYSVAVFREPIVHNTMPSLTGFYGKQKAGAKTFVRRGFGTMNLSLGEVFYEQYVLGLKSVVNGFIERDASSFLIPPYMLARTIAYGMEVLNPHRASDSMICESTSEE